MKKILVICFLIASFNFSVFGETAPDKYIEIDVLARRLSLKDSQNNLIKSYPIGVGRSKQFMTPPGSYKVQVKDPNPGWYNPYTGKGRIPPGPRNPLGTRWIGFHNVGKAVYGIHGTNEPSSVGKFVSHGCIRMLIPDSEDLYSRVEVGTPVIVAYKRFEITDREGDIVLTVNEDPYGLEPLTIENITQKVKAKYPNAVLSEAALKYLIENQTQGAARLIGYIQNANQPVSSSNQ